MHHRLTGFVDRATTIYSVLQRRLTGWKNYMSILKAISLIVVVTIVGALAPLSVAAQPIPGGHFDVVVNVSEGFFPGSVDLTASFVENAGVVDIIGDPHCATSEGFPISLVSIGELDCYAHARIADSYVDLTLTYKRQTLAQPIISNLSAKVVIRVGADRSVAVLESSSWLQPGKEITGRVIDKGWVAGQPEQDPDATMPAELPPGGAEPEPTSPPIQPEDPGSVAPAPAPATEAPLAPTVPAACESILPVLTTLMTFSDGNYSTSEPVSITFQVYNFGCKDYGTVGVQLVDQAPDGQTYIIYSGTLNLFPGGNGGTGVNADLVPAGQHKIWVEIDLGTGWQRVVNDPDRPDDTGTMSGVGDRHVDGYLTITVDDSGSNNIGSDSSSGASSSEAPIPAPSSGTTIISSYDGSVVSGFSADCSYSWSPSRSAWIESSCGNQPPDLTGPQLSEPPSDGCSYYFNGSTFQRSPSYPCGQD